ncbi:MAG: tRNA (adenosine(37)-N6)-threonylcarbamoyltransferase complex ATPase subunit type 1 TsaE [Eubacterium sp.]|nr:tRNA (adenosine(37)-N6)-threonylcarbamoyltransferase complex ATPase subunit type 1 TsaE [Eubacterium sp.]
MPVIYETYSAEETAELGKRIAQQLQPGSVCALVGELGVGKTVFTQGLAQGLGITEPVCSPTFTIVQVYEEGRMPFYHFDVYRIADLQEMEEIGYEEYFYGSGVALVEWADLITELMPLSYQKITIEKDLEKGFDYRRILVEQVRREPGGVL